MSNNPQRLDIEENRANQAFNEVNKLKDDKLFAKKYKSLVKKTPARIKNCGFAETLAFIFSKQKGKNHFDKLYSQLGRRLEYTGYISNSFDFMQQIVLMEKSNYRSATNEMLAYLAWLKRFTEGLIEGEEDESNED